MRLDAQTNVSSITSITVSPNTSCASRNSLCLWSWTGLDFVSFHNFPLHRSMENLSINDPPPAGGQEAQQHAQPMPPMVPQLPPQMFTTAAQLLDLTDSWFTLGLSQLV